jgi:demethylspheroidene O-methyltransferase
MTAEAVAEAFELDSTRTLRLLEAASGLGLLERRPRRHWGLGPQGAVLISDPGLRAMSLHHRALYEDLAKPLELLRDPDRETTLAKLWPYAQSDIPSAAKADDVREYTALMADSQRMIAEQVLDAFDFSPHRALLDIGGGNGTFLSRVHQAHPQLELALFDLPGVIELAGQRAANGDLPANIELHGGSFHSDSFPGVHDLISLIRIIHDHDDEPAQALLNKAFDALQPGGRLLLAEPMLSRKDEGGTLGNYFRFYLMAMGSGRPRSPAELKRMLKQAGFERIRRHRTSVPMICSVMSAERPNA